MKGLAREQAKANKLAKQGLAQQTTDAALMREQAAKTAEEYRVQSEADAAALREQYAAMTKQLETTNQSAPPTQVIQDERLRRNGMGMSMTRAMNPYGLGGGYGTLG